MTNLLDFDPTTLTIRPGETVEWQNTSLFSHTVADDPVKGGENAQQMALPKGAEPFRSGTVAAGQVYTHRFLVPGTYRYICEDHVDEGMVGTVVVAPPSR